MPTGPDSDPNDISQSQAFATVHRALGRVPAEFSTAGELAALMAALPPHTPVGIAETVQIDPDLELGTTPNYTAAAVTVVTMAETQGSGDDPTDEHTRVLPGVELGAFIITEGGPVPERTTAFPAYESAVEALQKGDVAKALEAEGELLRWMASTLADPLPEDGDSDTTPVWITDIDLREELAVEGERLSQCAARLAILRARLLATS